METWQEEQTRKQAEKTKQLAELFENLRAPLAAEGFSVRMGKDAFVGGERDHDRIIISVEGLPMFRAIIDSAWNDSGRASFWLEDKHTVIVELKGYYKHDGSSNWRHDNYTFTDLASNDELEAMGVKMGVSYRRELGQFSKDFKVDKKIKLILNDILPALKILRELVTLTAPRVLAKINKENDTFELQKKVAVRCRQLGGHHYIPSELGRYSFTIPKIGEVEITEYGGITLKRGLTAEELKTLLEIK